jgi:hypothetical protein
VLPKDTFGIAVNYALKHWEALTNFTKAGHLDASYNYAERCMRTVAIGRKAFLFVGSERASHAAAIYYSLVESCKANNSTNLRIHRNVLNGLRTSKVSFIVRDNYAVVRFGDGSDNHIQVASGLPCDATFRHETSPDQCRFLVK